MKKQHLKSLKLSKKIIVNDYSLKGGIRDITDPSLDPDADCGSNDHPLGKNPDPRSPK
ncbi:hypothetical protein [Kordia sp.]|uniref:hypothetical protein n=1 Tax=Kordia sp. TaxID=1965332 RepID=UPI0025B947E5|nr:hypothetical protein [Kordia sp.]MCH2195811.1 hypothetical protein [Kordia sp.]